MSGRAITIESVPTFRDLQGRFAKAEKGLLESRRDMMRHLGQRFVAIAQQKAPRKTGTFAGGIRFRTFVEGDALGFNVTTPQPLGKWIIGGTKAHWIIARRSRLLRFFWAKGPHGPGIYFYPFVWHPGTKPSDFILETWNEWDDEARTQLHLISTKYIATLESGQ